MVTVVTEGIFSYCGVKVKIDTDRYLGPEQAAVRVKGEAVGHVTTAEYGSQMLSLGGVHHLVGGSKKEGVVTCDALLALCNKEAVELSIDGGSTVVVQADRPPVVNGVAEQRMRVGCGSAAIGMFAPQWKDHVDEVIVVDDHITGVLSEHQGGRFLDMKPAGIRVRGRRSTPGRYFQVAQPGSGFYVVAKRKSELVGALLITKEWSDWRNGDFWWVQSVYVVPEQRGRGVYRRLYRHVQRLAVRQRAVVGFRLYVDQDNTRARRVYRSLGMKETRYLVFEQLKPGIRFFTPARKPR